MVSDEGFQKLLKLLKVCPTCGKPLQMKDGTSILICADRYHGSFTVIWFPKTQGYSITYSPQARAV